MTTDPAAQAVVATQNGREDGQSNGQAARAAQHAGAGVPLTPTAEAVIDPRKFRRALGNFATGVTVMTASADGRKVGVTANSFNSVSLDPPLILWSIDKRSGSYPVFAQASHFAVNVLAVGQIALSNQFARPGDDRYAGVPHRPGIGGSILLEDTAASFQCEKHQIIDGGDHWIMIGKVVAYEDSGRDPLLYHQGAYSMVLPHPELEEREEVNAPRTEFHSRLVDNYFYLMSQAMRAHQEACQPERRQGGWSAGESRVLLVLDADQPADLATVVHQAVMPAREVEPVLRLLRERGLVRQEGSGFMLTPEGHRQAQAVWDMARRQQDRVFASFSDEEKALFADMLKRVIVRC
ncbi:flavin reductase family protein [Lautropia mirabilis]|uniref:p-hydroxyphenylacetate 3-hydroxylase reductase component n=1 Tax=Lautropia mirabilis TaxID=47671 RepID=UPI002348EFD6|nr:flavin reductase family protein [Lautropia mirabilis]MDC6093740.1 flavin reductase family protein [Lautropia mirabilis]